MITAFIIHRWDGTPQSDWYQALSKELRSLGYKVVIPEMPNTSKPEVEAWVGHLKQVVGDTPLDQSVFIGHSIGCQAVLRYFETLPDLTHVPAVYFVAGWIHLENLEDEESQQIAKQWLETPINFEKVGVVCQKYLAIFSTNDPWVPLSDVKLFEDLLHTEAIVIENAGHFTEEDGYNTPPPQIIEQLPIT